MKHTALKREGERVPCTLGLTFITLNRLGSIPCVPFFAPIISNGAKSSKALYTLAVLWVLPNSVFFFFLECVTESVWICVPWWADDGVLLRVLWLFVCPVVFRALWGKYTHSALPGWAHFGCYSPSCKGGVHLQRWIDSKERPTRHGTIFHPKQSLWVCEYLPVIENDFQKLATLHCLFTVRFSNLRGT